METTTLVMIRHGRPSEEVVGTHYGQTDVALSDRGRVQSLAVVEQISATKIDAIYSSDLQRAYWLADKLAESRSLVASRLPILRERSIGIFHGMTYAEGLARYPEEARMMRSLGAMHRPPEGEDLTDLAGRVLPAVADIVAAHPAQTVVVVGHGGPMRVVLGDALAMPLEAVERISIEYCGVSAIDYRQGTPRVRQINA